MQSQRYEAIDIAAEYASPASVAYQNVVDKLESSAKVLRPLYDEFIKQIHRHPEPTRHLPSAAAAILVNKLPEKLAPHAFAHNIILVEKLEGERKSLQIGSLFESIGALPMFDRVPMYDYLLNRIGEIGTEDRALPLCSAAACIESIPKSELRFEMAKRIVAKVPPLEAGHRVNVLRTLSSIMGTLRPVDGEDFLAVISKLTVDIGVEFLNARAPVTEHARIDNILDEQSHQAQLSLGEEFQAQRDVFRHDLLLRSMRNRVLTTDCEPTPAERRRLEIHGMALANVEEGNLPPINTYTPTFLRPSVKQRIIDRMPPAAKAAILASKRNQKVAVAEA